MSGLFGGSDKTQTQTTTQGTSYPAWITGAQQGASTAATNMATPFLQTPNYGVAGFTPDSLKGFDLARGVAQNAFTGSPVRGVGAAPTMANTINASSANATAAQISPDMIAKQMNPFISGVVDPTLDALRRDKNASAAEIGARSAAAGAFGGSREALQRGLLDRSSAETASQTVAQLMAQGYDRATATAQAEAEMWQQASLQNANNSTATSQFNTGAANSTSQFNANLGTDFATRAPTIEDGLRNNEQARQINALQLLLGTGATQQGQAQAAIDLPWTNLQRLLGTIPQVYDSTQSGSTTAPDNSPGFLQQILGAGTALGTAYLRGGA